MTRLRQALTVAGYNFSHWRKNPRVLLTFALALILCFLLSDKAVQFSQQQGTLLQLVEPFVWAFGDSDSILLSSLLLVLLFSDLPFLSPATPYYLIRMDRKTWLLGQVLYVLGGTLLYLAFLLFSAAAVCARQSYLGNLWSETAAILGYSGAGKDVALPALVRTLELSTPYSCMAMIFVLMLLYALLLMSVFLLFRLRLGQAGGTAAVFAFSLYGFLLSPKWLQALLGLSEEEQYWANVAVGWLSPLNHAAYHMHNFGYDLLPRLWQSCLLFVLLIGLCQALCARVVRRYPFQFTGGEDDT
ncbi:MAG: hypothetical protein LUC39_07670 [Clostridiales bacterium]|nr:hypothetical protein [Clostridiales bacterium]